MKLGRAEKKWSIVADVVIVYGCGDPRRDVYQVLPQKDRLRQESRDIEKHGPIRLRGFGYF